MRMVANVRSLSSRSSCIFLSRDDLEALISEMSLGDKLKNAISEPLAKPERPSSTKVSTQATATPTDMVPKLTSENEFIR